MYRCGLANAMMSQFVGRKDDEDVAQQPPPQDVKEVQVAKPKKGKATITQKPVDQAPAHDKKKKKHGKDEDDDFDEEKQRKLAQHIHELLLAQKEDESESESESDKEKSGSESDSD